MDTTPSTPTRRYRWCQFSLRTLFLFVSVAGCGLGWLGIKVQAAQRQQQAIAAFTHYGGRVVYDYQWSPDTDITTQAKPPEPEWLRSLVGDDLFHNVVKVHVCDDEQMKYLKEFPCLRSLQFSCTTNVTDVGLRHLEEIPQIQRLRFGANEKITDRSLAYLRPLTQLRYLYMRYLNISDAGLEHLTDLTTLQELHLANQPISDDGVYLLQTVLANCRIERAVH